MSSLDDLMSELDTAATAIANAQAIVKAQMQPAIKTPAEFDAAYAAATPGAVLVLDASFAYPNPVTIDKSVTLSAVAPITARATPTALMPSFLASITVTGNNVVLAGIHVQHTHPDTDIVVLNGTGILMDGCRVMGNAATGAKRGIQGNAANLTVRRTYVADCFSPTPGYDSQAFAAWNTPGPVNLTDCYFSGSAESVLFGGADPVDSAHVPSNITIDGCTLTKDPAWQTAKYNGTTADICVKNVLELKNATHVTVQHCEISECWGGHGQDGYLLMLTPRNQDGTAPYSGVAFVDISANRFANAAGAVAMLGHDSPNISGPLSDLSLVGNTFENIDPVAFTGADKLILILDGPLNTTVSGNTFTGNNLGSQVYFDGSPKCVNLDVTNNTWPPATYGVFGAGCAPGGVTGPTNNAWQTFVASGTLDANTII
jgi:hypothetical protein